MRRIAVLMSLAADDKEGRAGIDAFMQGLGDWAGSTVVTCSSTFAGRQVATAFANNTLQRWSRCRRT